MGRGARSALIAACLLATAGAAAQPVAERFGEPVAIHDPSGHALDPLHAALRRARAGEGRARIMIWGASHTAEDLFPGLLREAWQRRFGDAGAGLWLPARPFPLYESRVATFADTGAWRPVRVRGRRRAPDRYGPAGFAIEATGRARGFVAVRRPADAARLLYLRQAGGGTLVVRAGDQHRRLSTDGDAVASEALTGPLRRVELRALGDGPVRVFGVSLENDRPGVVIDAMGVPGARLRDRLPWDDRAMRRQLAELAPDLIVLAYGTNESGFTGRPIARYRAEVDEALRRAREIAPRAGCLVIGPSDWPLREGGELRARPRITQVIAVQRELAARHGCGHFDLQAWQGGPSSMPRWVRAGLALPDHVHFTEPGHRRLARDLSRALLAGLTD